MINTKEAEIRISAIAKELAADIAYRTLGGFRIGNLPNVFIVGGIRCGTTSLASFLSNSRSATCGLRKEPGYFTRHFEQGASYYRANFPERAEFIVDGTPDYMFRPVALERLAATIENPRILVMLRDPFARAKSHYLHALRYGWKNLIPFEQAVSPNNVAQNLFHLKLDKTLPGMDFMYAEQSCYDYQIQRLRTMFESVHVMCMENWVRFPLIETHSLCNFFQIATDTFEHDSFPHINKGSSSSVGFKNDWPPFDEGFFREENEIYYNSLRRAEGKL